MAENNSELDTINHLLEVERNASALINDAKTEAEKRVSEARVKYNTEYKEKYSAIADNLEKEYLKKHDEIEVKYRKEIDEYKATLENKSQDGKTFSDLLEKLLFA